MPLITEKVVKLTVTEGEKKKRIDTFLANVLENTSRSRIQNLIKNQLVTANNNIVKASYLIEPGDIIELKIPIKPRPDKIEPENIECWLDYGDTLLELNLYEEAKNSFKNVINLNPEWAEGYYHLSKVYAQLRNFSKSAYWLHTAISIDPNKKEEYKNEFPELLENNNILPLNKELEKLVNK